MTTSNLLIRLGRVTLPPSTSPWYVNLSLFFCGHPLTGITCRHQHLSVVVSLQPADSHLFNQIQVLVLSTWTIILSNDPKSLGWFSFHPTLNTFAIACFTFGPFITVSFARTNCMRAYRHPHTSTNVPAKDEGRGSLAPPNRDDYGLYGY